MTEIVSKRSKRENLNTIYLVRHAHSIWTPDEDRPLSPEGFKAARQVADRLGSMPIEAIYASSSRRAWQTVEPLAHALGLPLYLHDNLVERVLTTEIVDDFQGTVRWCWDHPELAHPGGESNKVAQQRGMHTLEEILRKHPGDTVVIGTHGNLLALIVAYYLPNHGFDFWSSLSMPDIYRLELGKNGNIGLARVW